MQQKVSSAASAPAKRKRIVKLEAELNRLKKLEIKTEQRLLNHKQRFVATYWHRKRCEPGSERAIYWMAIAQSAFDGWLGAANLLIDIASRRCLAERHLAALSGGPGKARNHPGMKSKGIL